MERVVYMNMNNSADCITEFYFCMVIHHMSWTYLPYTIIFKQIILNAQQFTLVERVSIYIKPINHSNLLYLFNFC